MINIYAITIHYIAITPPLLIIYYDTLDLFHFSAPLRADAAFICHCHIDYFLLCHYYLHYFHYHWLLMPLFSPLRITLNDYWLIFAQSHFLIRHCRFHWWLLLDYWYINIITFDIDYLFHCHYYDCLRFIIYIDLYHIAYLFHFSHYHFIFSLITATDIYAIRYIYAMLMSCRLLSAFYEILITVLFSLNIISLITYDYIRCQYLIASFTSFFFISFSFHWLIFLLFVDI